MVVTVYLSCITHVAHVALHSMHTADPSARLEPPMVLAIILPVSTSTKTIVEVTDLPRSLSTLLLSPRGDREVASFIARSTLVQHTGDQLHV